MLSPFVGSVFVTLLKVGDASEKQWEGVLDFVGVLFYAFLMVIETFWVTLPVGILTALMIRLVFQHWPPPNDGRPEAAALGIPRAGST